MLDVQQHFPMDQSAEHIAEVGDMSLSTSAKDKRFQYDNVIKRKNMNHESRYHKIIGVVKFLVNISTAPWATTTTIVMVVSPEVHKEPSLPD